MSDIYILEVVTSNSDAKEIFINGKLSQKTDERELMVQLTKGYWVLVTSHAYVKDNFVHEKYVFVQQ